MREQIDSHYHTWMATCLRVGGGEAGLDGGAELEFGGEWEVEAVAWKNNQISKTLVCRRIPIPMCVWTIQWSCNKHAFPAWESEKWKPLGNPCPAMSTTIAPSKTQLSRSPTTNPIQPPPHAFPAAKCCNRHHADPLHRRLCCATWRVQEYPKYSSPGVSAYTTWKECDGFRGDAPAHSDEESNVVNKTEAKYETWRQVPSHTLSTHT